MVPPIVVPPGEVGTSFSGVLSWRGMVADLYEYELIGADTTVLLVQQGESECFTAYDLRVQATEPVILCSVPGTVMIPVKTHGNFNERIVEVCAGTGGIGIGCEQIQGKVVASLDCCPLACDHLQRNGRSVVLCRDICDDHAKRDLHLAIGQEPCALMAGFPCPPHSTQGSQLGALDPRHEVYVQILRTAYLLQVHSVVLECTPQAQFDKDVRSRLSELMDVMNWRCTDNTLALSHQWPSRRHRWWLYLCPMDWGVAFLPKWPEDPALTHVGQIFPFWSCWTTAEEDDLRLTEQELMAYCSPCFGQDKRLLTLDDRAPTILHSYGSALSACPCGCRATGFSMTTLLNRGLRGCYVLSERDQSPRYLHPMELAALLGFPTTTLHLDPPRHALCLLGLVASPLQALWTYSALKSAAAGLDFASTLDRALQALSSYKASLLMDFGNYWAHLPPLPQPLTLHMEGCPDIQVRVWGSSTVADILQAEQVFADEGATLQLCLGDTPLPLPQRLAPLRFSPDCWLRVTTTMSTVTEPATLAIGVAVNDETQVTLIAAGSFLFEALASCSYFPHEVASVTLLDGTALAMDSRLWEGGVLKVTLRTAPHFASGTFGPVGLASNVMEDVTNALYHLRYHATQTRPALLGPEAAARFLTGTWTSVDATTLRDAFELGNDTILCIVAIEHHWILLWGTSSEGSLSWICYDGLHLTPHRAVLDFASSLSSLLDFGFHGLTSFRLVRQRLEDSCGTVALMHFSIILGLRTGFSVEEELVFHRGLQKLPIASGSILAAGLNTPDLQAKLATLLQEKGVPIGDMDSRAAEAIRTLGAASVVEAMKAKNPWAALKGLASRPSSRMRLVKEHELREHIDQQATSKHGGHIAKHKTKKATKGAPQPLPLMDPADLQLLPSTFVDDEGDAIPQIPFAQVSSDAHGLAFCTFKEAQPFLEAGAQISTLALGLLINSEVPQDLWGTATVSHLRYPALCAATSEPVLIHGTLLTLGDSAIHRQEVKVPTLQVQSTDIVKLQIFRDEVEIAWPDLTSGPIKALLGLAPILRLCSGKDCGSECPHSHSPIDEELSGIVLDVWSRGYFTPQGKATKPDQSAYFQCLIRIPSVVLESIIRQNLCGIYFEPRAAETKGVNSDFTVLWMTGLNRDQTLHRLRTSAHGLSLARMHSRYGIRVKTGVAELAHKELKPDETFNAVQVRQVYTLFPVPHGVHRQQIQRLLDAWKWAARPLQAMKGNHTGMSRGLAKCYKWF